MFYIKNVPVWERIVRSLAGITMVAAGLVFFVGNMQLLLISSGIIAALTGFLGFCPMCYMVGRKLK